MNIRNREQKPIRPAQTFLPPDASRPSPRQFRAPHSALRACRAFTLLELLVVIVIIGLLAAIGLPAIRGMTKSNVTIAANRQLLDDISYARQRAIADHTKVYMVFIPPQIISYDPPNLTLPVGDPILQKYTNLYIGQCTTYVLLSLRSVGEQPGRSTPHYLTEWRSLPTGCFIATNKFATRPLVPPSTTYPELNINPFPLANFFPFPVATNAPIGNLPYLAFNYLGQLEPALDVYIPLALGSILHPLAVGGGYDLTQPADILETPPGNSYMISNVIHIDWLTGRSRIERQEVQ